ncbi:hypothetical protein PGT21_037111 [Puccinia graminis f. sp. tritici]|uniref:Uncharacterized protein n=1 Tax=Puccinia graminis f. sp. tritici TaxID=56615 RepID=A0A5B0QQQ8_PUCGR|nr:hypothetical protein PGT21_037111 [Puccinia graminis f. sp. tritici]
MKPGPKTVPRPDPANVAVWVGSGHKVNIAAQTRPTWGSRRVRVGSGRFAVTLASGGVADASETPGAEVATSESKVFSQESINVIHIGSRLIV